MSEGATILSRPDIVGHASTEYTALMANKRFIRVASPLLVAMLAATPESALAGEAHCLTCEGGLGNACEFSGNSGMYTDSYTNEFGTWWVCSWIAPPVTWVTMAWDQLPQHQVSQGEPVYRFRYTDGTSSIVFAESQTVSGTSKDEQLPSSAQCGGYGGLFYQWAPYDSSWEPQPWTEVSYYTVTPNPSAGWGTKSLWWQADSQAVSYRLRIIQAFGDHLVAEVTGIQDATYDFQGQGDYWFEAFAQRADGTEVPLAVPSNALTTPLSWIGSFSVGSAAPQRPSRTVSWDAAPAASKYTVRLAKDARNFGSSPCEFSEESIPLTDENGEPAGSTVFTREEPHGLLMIRPEVLDENYDLDEMLEYGHTYFVRVEAKTSTGSTLDVHECSFEVEPYDGTDEHETIVCDGAPPSIDDAEFEEDDRAYGVNQPGTAVGVSSGPIPGSKKVRY